jgi:hypothetical protein
MDPDDPAARAAIAAGCCSGKLTRSSLAQIYGRAPAIPHRRAQPSAGDRNAQRQVERGAEVEQAPHAVAVRIDHLDRDRVERVIRPDVDLIDFHIKNAGRLSRWTVAGLRPCHRRYSLQLQHSGRTTLATNRQKRLSRGIHYGDRPPTWSIGCVMLGWWLRAVGRPGRSSAEVPMPDAAHPEQAVLPQPATIAAAARSLVRPT